MCGIYGWNLSQGIRNNPRARFQLETLAGAMVRDVQGRGRDSWGNAVTARGRIVVRRGLGLTPTLPPMALSAIGHTRAATHGAVTVENAHPFRCGPVVYAHNGIVWNADKLGDWPVDSMALGPRIAKGHHDLSDISTYGAVTWLDDRTRQQAYLAKLSRSGDLEVGIVDLAGGVRAVLWASQVSRLNEAIEVLGLEVVIKPGKWSLSSGTVYIARGGKLHTSKRKFAVNESSWGNWDSGLVARTRGDTGSRYSEPDWERDDRFADLRTRYGVQSAGKHRYSTYHGYFDGTHFTKWEDAVEETMPAWARKRLHEMTDAEWGEQHRAQQEDLANEPATVTIDMGEPTDPDEVH